VLDEAIRQVFAEAEVPRGVIVELERKRDEVYHVVIDLARKRLLRMEEVSRSFLRLGLGESSTILDGLLY